MKQTIVLSAFLFYFQFAWADENRYWKTLHECSEAHIEGIAKHVPSLVEGASLITQSLCANQSANLINFLVKNRTDDVGKISFSERFGVYLSIVQRELILRIYQKRIELK